MKTLLSLCFVFSLIMNINAQIQQDKVKHFIVGGTIASTTSILVYSITDDKKKALLIGLGTGFLAGAAKEIYDSTGRGCCDFRDFTWTCIGSSMTSFVFTIKF